MSSRPHLKGSTRLPACLGLRKEGMGELLPSFCLSILPQLDEDLLVGMPLPTELWGKTVAMYKLLEGRKVGSCS